ncbi:hypothetical protein DUNSADRAFT_8796 [Dunaliella salina]|uniref:Uncharacterized protein n=1 Tax=Dunaliella salina TaxID=3046 RepID=A0ABQ7GIT4_DUNSA|nr:hypothetical protein DUNSADRAFT_8796 [Dunaliella salina]|eukprot:KAF5834503.1 hypothetical protein DUNSADRAFT_8796 [Dunaliella salina]
MKFKWAAKSKDLNQGPFHFGSLFFLFWEASKQHISHTATSSHTAPAFLYNLVMNWQERSTSPFLRIPPGVLSNPAFDGKARRTLSQTSRAMHEHIMLACTTVTVSIPMGRRVELGRIVGRLRQCAAEGLHLRKLILERGTASRPCTWCLNALAPLTSLEHLVLSNIDVLDLEPLTALRLQRLDLSGLLTERHQGPNSPTVRGLHAMTGLKSLNCSNLLRVQDLGPLAALDLCHLDCSHMKGVDDIGPLAGLSNLQTLYCNSTSVSDLQPLANLSTLHTLNCADLPCVSSLSPLSGLTSLESLNCQGLLRVTDVSPISFCTRLKHLDCCHMGRVSGLGLLAGLTSLDDFYFDGTYSGTEGDGDCDVEYDGESEIDPMHNVLTGLQNLSMDHDDGDLSFGTPIW